MDNSTTTSATTKIIRTFAHCCYWQWGIWLPVLVFLVFATSSLVFIATKMSRLEYKATLASRMLKSRLTEEKNSRRYPEYDETD